MAQPRTASPGVSRRANKRLAKLRAEDPKALPGVKAKNGAYNLAQAVAIKKALAAQRAKAKTAPPAAAKPAPYSPLDPLTGPNLDAETSAASKLQFGDTERQLRDARGGRAQTTANTSQYYDDYTAALKAATGRIAQANTDAVTASQGRVDTAATQDQAAVDARDKAATDSAAARGIQVAPDAGASAAVRNQRAMGNAAVTNQSTRGQADVTRATLREPTSVQAKAEAMGSEANKTAKLDAEDRALAEKKGAFAVDFRNKTRAGEREWAAVQSEFNLKSDTAKAQAKAHTTDADIEKQKIASQKIVARIYAGADKAKAQAQVRVAKLQLEKGKISQKQYREIVNIYKGLPAKGKPTPAKTAPKSSGSGSGANGALAPWEIDARDRAYTGFGKNKYKATDHGRAITKAVQAGIPKRMAEAAWQRYVKTLTNPYTNRAHG